MASKSPDAEKEAVPDLADDAADANLVTWDGPSDPENPKNWSRYRKWAITLTLSAIGFMTIMTSTIVAPALGPIAGELRMTDVEEKMALSAYVLALAFGPLIISPQSEVWGRLPVIHGWNVWFLVWNLVCGFANQAGLLIAARFLAGLGGSLDYAISISILGELFEPEERGLSLGFYNFIPLLGTVVGPIIGGYLTQGLSWRWLFYITTIVQAAIILLSVFTIRETHNPTILSRRALRLRKSSANPHFHTASEKDASSAPASAPEAAPTRLSGALRRSLTRPFRLLATHPAIQVISLVYAFNFGILFFVLSTFADLWVVGYGQSVASSGLHYAAWVVGELLGAGLAAPVLDRVWAALKQRRAGDGGAVPEYRVPLMLPGALLVPAGLFAYGWAAQARAFWLVPDVCAAVLGAGTMSSTMAVHSYLIDAYPDHTASANAAASFLSSLFGFLFPLFAPQMYKTLGYGWGNSLLGFIAIAVGFSGVWILWTYGARMRAKAKSTE